MDRKELTYRLSVLGMKKKDFAERLGMAPDTLYQWEVVPQYAAVYLEALEEVRKLREQLKRLGVTK